jgi:hypothetical protein
MSFLFLFFDFVRATVVDYVYDGFQPFNLLALIISIMICLLIIKCYLDATRKRETAIVAGKTRRDVVVQHDKKIAFDLPSDNAVVQQRAVPATATAAAAPAVASPKLSATKSQVLVPASAHIDEAVAFSIKVLGSDDKPFVGVTPSVEIYDDANIVVPHSVRSLLRVEF